MDVKLQQYYEARLDMMGSKGWKDLMEDVSAMLQSTDTLSGVTPENVRFKQGEISIMKWLLTLKQTSEQTLEDLQREDTP
jgi:hypothetical protein